MGGTGSVTFSAPAVVTHGGCLVHCGVICISLAPVVMVFTYLLYISPETSNGLRNMAGLSY